MLRRAGVITVVLLIVLAATLLLWRRAPLAPGPSPTLAVDAPSVAREPLARPEARPLSPIELSPVEVAEAPREVAGLLLGHVLSRGDGRGVAGAQLSFLHAGKSVDVETDATGAFRLVPAEPGRYTLVAVDAAGHLPFAPEWGHSPVVYDATAGRRVEGAVVYLSPAFAYAGVVVDASGAPVAGARLYLRGGVEDAAAPAAVADSKGEFSLEPPDGVVVEARHEGYAPGRVAIDFAAQVTRRLRIVMRPRGVVTGQRIAGVVLDPEAQPVADALVVAGLRRSGEGGLGVRVLSGADGRFLLEELEAGDYSLEATYGGYAPAYARATTGAEAVTLRLVAGGRVEGRVTDARHGRPVAAFSAVASCGRRGPVTRVVSVLDAAGTYELAGLPLGRCAVQVVAHGYAPAASRSLQVTSPEVARADFALERGGRVHGVVVDEPTRSPIAAARISAEGALALEDSAVPLLAAAVTDAGGRFELVGLGVGLRSINVMAAGHHGRIVSGIAVTDDGDVGPLTVALSPLEPGEEPKLELVGIGAGVGFEHQALFVLNVLPSGGAAEVGLARGDAILVIDGHQVAGLGFEGAIERLRGPEDTVVTLSVHKRGAEGATELRVPRRRVRY